MLRDCLMEKCRVIEVTKVMEWREAAANRNAEYDDKEHQYTELHDWHPVYCDINVGPL
jgi:hypothetical protein